MKSEECEERGVRDEEEAGGEQSRGVRRAGVALLPESGYISGETVKVFDSFAETGGIRYL